MKDRVAQRRPSAEACHIRSKPFPSRLGSIVKDRGPHVGLSRIDVKVTDGRFVIDKVPEPKGPFKIDLAPLGSQRLHCIIELRPSREGDPRLPTAPAGCRTCQAPVTDKDQSIEMHGSVF